MKVTPLLAVATAVMVLASCGSSSTGPASPVASPDPRTAPTVATPREARQVADEPCSQLLTEEELRRFGFREPGRQRDLYGVVECRWLRGGESRDDTLSMYVDVTNDLLPNVYRTWRGFFVPAEIEGMPAVQTKSDRGQFNTCTVTTGLAPRQALETTWFARGDPAPGNDACEFAEQAATLVVRKLPPA